ncbi:MAG: VanZ family protein [Verrucomicrobia bacterium]|jgi:VanZ family protein|nr:VanZ family protein [Verrucomicrobiota bacterium]OQC65589.1 MAG: VanZ like family protein [Verrucomicrobia bacterium ADurb.Bin006]MDI9380515.1 VanZ family protein [Verrucomicrobiota bacterium]NMD22143.1 VanZ family protein [Verrucomicrobiota bacterium]HOA59917.1 VanZ family protein [Verrucomicrobiota bacterium]
MSWLRSTARVWLPVLIWAALIFTGSGDLLSEGRTSRFIGPVLRWFKPDLSDATVRRIQVVVRKGGHLTEYAILALLSFRALSRSGGVFSPAWSWRAAWLALGFCALYATADEVRQSFVPSRYGSPLDVLIDIVGAAFGLVLAWSIDRWRRRGSPVEQSGCRG